MTVSAKCGQLVAAAAAVCARAPDAEVDAFSVAACHQALPVLGCAQEFLAGANNMDERFKNQPFQDNLPVLIGLMSIWNVSFLGHGAKAILPYCQVRRPGFSAALASQAYRKLDLCLWVCLSTGDGHELIARAKHLLLRTLVPSRRRSPSWRRTSSRCAPWRRAWLGSS